MSLHELIFGFTPATIAKHPDCFGKRTIDRHHGHRTVPIQVLSLGFCRTGTASMHAALTTLGFDTYHGFHMYSNIRDADMWRGTYERKYFGVPGPPLDRAFFDELLGHVGAVTDLPAVAFAREMIEAYPEAKVVLVERDVEGLYKSFYDVFVAYYRKAIMPWIAWVDWGYSGKRWWILTRGVAEGQCRAANTEEFAANAREMYRRHYAKVREVPEG